MAGFYLLQVCFCQCLSQNQRFDLVLSLNPAGMHRHMLTQGAKSEASTILREAWLEHNPAKDQTKTKPKTKPKQNKKQNNYKKHRN